MFDTPCDLFAPSFLLPFLPPSLPPSLPPFLEYGAGLCVVTFQRRRALSTCLLSSFPPSLAPSLPPSLLHYEEGNRLGRSSVDFGEGERGEGGQQGGLPSPLSPSSIPPRGPAPTRASSTPSSLPSSLPPSLPPSFYPHPVSALQSEAIWAEDVVPVTTGPGVPQA